MHILLYIEKYKHYFPIYGNVLCNISQYFAVYSHIFLFHKGNLSDAIVYAYGISQESHNQTLRVVQ